MDRSEIMRRVGSKNTKPEMVVRKLLFGLGFRYRLHGSDLPGTPDIVFRAKKKVIFVNGCFWHGHKCKRGERLPKSNQEYWRSKIDKNRVRDMRVREDLKKMAWQYETIWECETKDIEKLAIRLNDFLISAPRRKATT